MKNIKLLIWVLPILILCSCSHKQNHYWVKTDKGPYILLNNKIGDSTYVWTGDSICGLANGKGELKIYDQKGNLCTSKKLILKIGIFDDAKYVVLNTLNRSIIYCGSLDSDEHPKGLGVMFVSDSIIISNFDEGIVSGYTTIFKKKKISYRGNMDDGKKNDFGIEYWKNGNIKYYGYWEKGNFNGYGTLYNTIGIRLYKGNWKQGTKNGLGISYDNNGKPSYTGYWKDNLYNGKGTFYTKSGIERHVWRKGKLPDSTVALYKDLNSRKTEFSQNSYNVLLDTYYFYEKYSTVIYVLIVIFFLLLGTSLYLYYRYCEKMKYDRAKSINPINLFLIWLFGGFIALHRVRLLQKWQFIISYIVFAVLVIINLKNITLYVIVPNCWLSLWKINMPTIMLTAIIVIWWLVDLLLMPYVRYRLICRYYRRDKREMDILNGKGTDIEDFYYNLSSRVPEINIKSDKLIEKTKRAFQKKNHQNFGQKILRIFGADNSLDFEAGKTDTMENYLEEAKGYDDECAEFARQAKKYLMESRNAAFRNLALAKELIRLVRRANDKKQHIQEDNVENFSVIKLDNFQKVCHKTDVKIGKTFQDINERFGNNIVTSFNSFSFRGIFTGLGLSIIFFWAENLIARIETKGKLVERQGKIIDLITDASNKRIKNLALLLRYSEVISSLYESNKAFITAYVELRDEFFGKGTFKDFLRYYFHFGKPKIDLGTKRSFDFLIKVCNEYNKINKTKI